MKKTVKKNRVRIIGGQWKRHWIEFPDSEGLRPTPDRVRETLFNWLGQTLYDLTCLDLFAGSGVLGFEAASRGAKRVIMVETQRTVQKALASTFKQFHSPTQITLIEADAFQWLAHCRETFDGVFLDPPFAHPQAAEKALEAVIPLLKENAWVYLECANPPDLEAWDIERTLKAGAVQAFLLKKKG